MVDARRDEGAEAEKGGVPNKVILAGRSLWRERGDEHQKNCFARGTRFWVRAIAPRASIRER